MPIGSFNVGPGPEPTAGPLEPGLVSPDIARPWLENEYVVIESPLRAPQAIHLTSTRVSSPPLIDGDASDACWSACEPVTTLDYITQREIIMQSVHTDSQVFMLASYPDPTESLTHKTWMWDATQNIYVQGYDREDSFVIKWSMSGIDANLSIHAGQPHRADLWFWKACRTDRSGFADDKFQELLLRDQPDSYRFLTDEGEFVYLLRSGDEGRSAYGESLPTGFQGPAVPRFIPRQPDGSRGDVRAKGKWSDGRWVVEFARDLATGHRDDLQLESGSTYLLGVACYEMAGTSPDPRWSQPLYRSGDVFDRIFLTIE